MPKEVITQGEYKQGDPWIQVGWDRHRYVQLGTLHEELGGEFVELNRESINRLIRLLRKARDQAFGADA